MDKKFVDRKGVNKCESEFLKAGFVFREQDIVDFGVDAIVEPRSEDYLSGKLLALQIKSGESYFGEQKGNTIIFRGEMKHYRYWSSYSIPVIIVLHNPVTDKCIWQLFDKNKAIVCGKTWKIEIPTDQEIITHKKDLVKIAENVSPYQRKKNSMLVAKDWMILARSGNELILEVSEWVNKSSGRGEFCLYYNNDNGDKEILLEKSLWGFEVQTYETVIKRLFPWADIEIDRDYYCEDCDSDYYEQYDEVGAKEGIYPYTIASGEVAYYRLRLSLNEIGQAFLLLDDFFREDEFFYTDKVFSE